MNTNMICHLVALWCLLALPQQTQSVPAPPAVPVTPPKYIVDKVPPKRHATPQDVNSPFYKHQKELVQMISKADELRKVGNLVESKQLYQKVYNEGISYYTYFHAVEGLGEVARLTGETTDALHFYRELVEVKPGQHLTTSQSDASDVRIKYALLLRSVGNYDEAWANYEAGMAPRTGWNLPKPPTVRREDVPTDRFVFSASLAAAEWFYRSDIVQAVAFARQAIAANPTHGLGWFYLGEITSESDPVTAKAAYTKAVLYGHGDYLDRAKSGLAFTTARVEKARTTAKP